jgi:hypothetical protein
LNGAPQFVYADEVNLLRGNIYTTEKNTESLIDASKEAGRKVNTEKKELCIDESSPELRELCNKDS